VIVLHKPMRLLCLVGSASLGLALLVFLLHCKTFLNKTDALRTVLSYLPMLTAETLREGIASGTFHNTCLSNLPTLAGMSLHSYQATLPKHASRHIADSHIDPVSGKPFGYSPVTPAGFALCLLTNTWEEMRATEEEKRWEEMFRRRAIKRERPYFWLWLPHKDDQGHRLFVGTDHRIYSRPDDRVSWYYQTFIEYLTPEELEQERRYRASHPHLP